EASREREPAGRARNGEVHVAHRELQSRRGPERKGLHGGADRAEAAGRPRGIPMMGYAANARRARLSNDFQVTRRTLTSSRSFASRRPANAVRTLSTSTFSACSADRTSGGRGAA